LSPTATLALDPATGLVDPTKATLIASVSFANPLLPFSDPTTPGTTDAVPQQTVIIPAATPSGTWYLFLYADDLRKVSELNETNNITPAATVVVADRTPPVIAAHADVIAEATGPAGAIVAYTAPAAVDAVDGAVPTTCAPASGAQFALGTNTITCTASDLSGNIATATFAVVVRDTTPPVLAAHLDVTVQATGPAGAIGAYATPAATDLVDGTDPVSCSPASGAQFSLGNTTVTCTAHDAAGNNATPTTFVVHVVDTTPPVLSLPSPVFGATSASGAVGIYTVTATDLVDGPVAVSCTPPSGSTFPIGTTTVTCSASDTRGNTATGSFVVTVIQQYGFVGVQNLPPPAGKVFNSGSAVPLRWQFTIAGAVFNSTAVNPKITISGPNGTLTFTPLNPGNSSFQLPSAANGWTWQFNWQTLDNTGRALPAGVYSITVTSQATGQTFSGGQATIR
jgi:hypothetical protein